MKILLLAAFLSFQLGVVPSQYSLTVDIVAADHGVKAEYSKVHGYGNFTNGQDGLRYKAFEFSSANCPDLYPGTQLAGRWQNENIVVLSLRMSGGAQECILRVKTHEGKSGIATFIPQHHAGD